MLLKPDSLNAWWTSWLCRDLNWALPGPKWTTVPWWLFNLNIYQVWIFSQTLKFCWILHPLPIATISRSNLDTQEKPYFFFAYLIFVQAPFLPPQNILFYSSSCPGFIIPYLMMLRIEIVHAVALNNTASSSTGHLSTLFIMISRVVADGKRREGQTRLRRAFSTKTVCSCAPAL